MSSDYPDNHSDNNNRIAYGSFPKAVKSGIKIPLYFNATLLNVWREKKEQAHNLKLLCIARSDLNVTLAGKNILHI